MQFKGLYLLLVVILLVVPIASAQDDGLTEEEQALLERVLTAVNAYQDFSSYTISLQSSEMQDIGITIAGTQQATTSNITGQVEATVVNANTDTPNVSGTGTVTVVETEAADETSYTLDSEFRFVDGVLYMNSAYSDGTGPEELPEGWTVVEDFESSEVLENLSLGNVLNRFMADTEESSEPDNVMDALEEIAAVATSITESEEEFNGVPVTAVTITFDWQGLSQAMGEEVDPENPIFAIFEQMEGDLGSFVVYLDENDQPAGYQLNFTLNLQDIDLSEFTTEVPAGTIVTMLMTAEQTATFSDINASLEPVTAPELGQ